MSSLLSHRLVDVVPARASLIKTGGMDVGRCRGEYLSATLSLLAMAVFLVDRAGCVLLANEAANSIVRTGDGLKAINRKLRASCPKADKALRQAIDQAVLCDHQGPRTGQAVVPRVGRRPLLLFIVPLGAHAGDLLATVATAVAMVVAMEPDARPWSRLDGIAHAYGLTAAESRLLAVIVDGEGVTAAAGRLGITRATARTQLQQIFAKTLTSRQGELIRLVANTLPPLRHGAVPALRPHVTSSDDDTHGRSTQLPGITPAGRGLQTA